MALKKSLLGRGEPGRALAIGLVFGGIFRSRIQGDLETIQKKKESGRCRCRPGELDD